MGVDVLSIQASQDTSDLFNDLPTQYRIPIVGRRSRSAHCGFEALAVRWPIPDRTVRLHAPRVEYGEPVAIERTDAEVLSIRPEGMLGYAYYD